jgi:hypothetical protein
MKVHTEQLDALFTVANEFVEKHYKPIDSKDKGIKILATINQLIELEKLSLTEESIKMAKEAKTEIDALAKEM